MAGFLNFDQIVSATRVMNNNAAAEAQMKEDQAAWGDTLAGCVKTKQKKDCAKARAAARQAFMKKHGGKIGVGIVASAVLVRILTA